MKAYKLKGRIEKLQWKPPRLIFRIERHGEVALGSSRAAIHLWTIDLDNLTATCLQDGHRQIRPNDKPLDTKALAEEIARLIRGSEEHDGLIWRPDGGVKVLTKKIIPETNKATTAGRRKRFTDALVGLLIPEWQRKSAGSHLIFERKERE